MQETKPHSAKKYHAVLSSEETLSHNTSLLLNPFLLNSASILYSLQSFVLSRTQSVCLKGDVLVRRGEYSLITFYMGLVQVIRNIP